MRFGNNWLRFLVPLFAAACLTSARAEEAWPSRPITLVVPGQPGSGNDVTGRALAKELGTRLGVPIIVENRSGGRGAVAMQFVARAKPDGYTLVVVIASTAVILPAITQKMAFSLKDFVPVSMYTGLPTVVVVSSASKFGSMQDLITQSRKAPGTINYGNGSTLSQMAMEMLNLQAGTGLVAIPYRGPAEAMTDLYGGRIDVDVEAVSAAYSGIKSGQARPLAILGAKRSSALPEVPTMAELGFNDFDFNGWGGIMAPAATPRDIVERLQKAIADALQSPALQQQFANLMVDILPSSSQEFALRIREETAKYERIARGANIPKE